MLNNKRSSKINLGADWTPYTDALPQGSIALGTVTQNKVTGALVFIEAKQEYLLIAPDLIHKLNSRKIKSAIHQAQTAPAELET